MWHSLEGCVRVLVPGFIVGSCLKMTDGPEHKRAPRHRRIVSAPRAIFEHIRLVQGMFSWRFRCWCGCLGSLGSFVRAHAFRCAPTVARAGQVGHESDPFRGCSPWPPSRGASGGRYGGVRHGRRSMAPACMTTDLWRG